MTAPSATTISEIAGRFRSVLTSPERVTELLSASEVAGLPVHTFPAPMRSPDGRARLSLLLALRSALGDLIARPDLVLTGASHTVHPDVDDAADHDLVHDLVVEQGDLDLEVPPSAALARFGIHASGFGGIDPDPLYAPQVVLLAAHGAGGHLVVLRAHLTAPIHDTEIALPSSDVRDDLEALRQRVWRQYAYVQLRAQMDQQAGQSSR